MLDETKRRMQHAARYVDQHFNGDAKGSERPVGFVLFVFNVGRAELVNYISNTADRAEIAKALRSMADRFEGEGR